MMSSTYGHTSGVRKKSTKSSASQHRADTGTATPAALRSRHGILYPAGDAALRRESSGCETGKSCALGCRDRDHGYFFLCVYKPRRKQFAVDFRRSHLSARRTAASSNYRSAMKKAHHVLSGFTLIELLVVIAIISLLASIVFASLNSARAKSRDARRKADLNQLRLALELYYDANGAYPSTIGFPWLSSEPTDSVPNNGGNWIPNLAPQYISVLPRDPKGGTGHPNPPCIINGHKEAYLYSSDTINYALLSHCAPEAIWTSSDPFYDPARPTWAWKVCSGPPACASW